MRPQNNKLKLSSCPPPEEIGGTGMLNIESFTRTGYLNNIADFTELPTYTWFQFLTDSRHIRYV